MPGVWYYLWVFRVVISEGGKNLQMNIRIYTFWGNGTNANTNNIQELLYLNIRIFVLITRINHPVLSLSPAPGTVQILLHFGGSVLLCPLLGTVYSLLHFGGTVLLSPLLLSPCTVHESVSTASVSVHLPQESGHGDTSNSIYGWVETRLYGPSR